MTVRDDFTAEEWDRIYQAPTMAGLVVMTAGRTGPVQTLKEAMAIGGVLVETEKHGTTNGLILAILAAVKDSQRPHAKLEANSLEQTHNQALERVKTVAALIEAKAPQDADEFKRWLVMIGQKVAEAAKEGSVLGFGGTQVTAEETSAIEALAAALGVPAT